MERLRVDRRIAKRKPRPDALPLDPRDPDVVRAEALTEKPVLGRARDGH